MGVQAFAKGWVSRTLPAPLLDGSVADVRLARYGELQQVEIVRKQHAAADDASYFTSNTLRNNSPIPSVSLNLVNPFMIVRSSEPPGATDGKRIYPDYVTLDCSTADALSAGTGGLVFGVLIDYMGVNDPSSAITIAAGAVCPNMDLSVRANRAHKTGFGAGTMTLTPSGNQRWVVGQRRLTETLGAGVSTVGVGDVFHIRFGGVEGGNRKEAATTRFRQVSVPPVVIGPGGMMLIYVWYPTAPTLTATPGFFCEIGWWER